MGFLGGCYTARLVQAGMIYGSSLALGLQQSCPDGAKLHKNAIKVNISSWSLLLVSCRPFPMFPNYCHFVSLRPWKDLWPKMWVGKPWVFWPLKLSLPQQIPVMLHVFLADWKTQGQMQFTAIKSQEGSIRRLWRDRVHDSSRCRNLLWRRWSASVFCLPPKNNSKSVSPVS